MRHPGKKSRPYTKHSAAMHSPDFGVSSLAGSKSNLWSLQARQDIFDRRQKGEDWETICKDYPTRTRHAMQQQYSVMKKQNAPDSPRFVSRSKRGRRTRVSARSKWAAVNELQDSSDDGLDSDPDLDIDVDDDEEEEYDSDDHVAEDDSHAADEDIAVVETDLKRDTTTRHSLLSRSATDPSTHPNIPRRATFPNLPGFAVPPTPNPENKPSLPEPSKRKIDPEATDSESRTSSHLSKRRKYSTEPVESLNPVPTDPPMTLKAFNENLKRDGMIFFPDTIAKAKEDYHSLVHAYTTEKTARQETFEAALKRHVRRVNEAEHKLQDMSQSFAEKLKVQEDAHAKELETVREESAALLAASRESVKHAPESPTLRSGLVEKEAQLARYEQMHSQLSPETEKLAQARTKAMQSSVSLKTQHDRLKKRIDTLMNDFEEVNMKTLRRYAIEIQEDCRVLTGLVSDEVGGWEDVGKAAECVEQTIAGIVKCKESAGLAEGAEKLVQQGEKRSDEAAEKEEKPGEKPIEGIEGENTIVVDATG